mmetsp:Transcript_32286/g.47359  ORF Transcript_32286/g.47359 Transcript_32286/m.47359 type:complete len:487 (-) Transcript_32286:46-1506(-)
MKMKKCGFIPKCHDTNQYQHRYRRCHFHGNDLVFNKQCHLSLLCSAIILSFFVFPALSSPFIPFLTVRATLTAFLPLAEEQHNYHHHELQNYKRRKHPKIHHNPQYQRGIITPKNIFNSFSSTSIFPSLKMTTNCIDSTAGNNNDEFHPHNDGNDNKNIKNEQSKYHYVNGIQCIEKHMSFSITNFPQSHTPENDKMKITLLEATADAQDELVDELILHHDDDDEMKKGQKPKKELKINSGDVYGAVLWPSSLAVANYLLFNTTNNNDANDNRKGQQFPLKGLTILELGAGTGLVSLVASRIGGASNVIATDYETLPLELLKYASLRLNPTKTATNTSMNVQTAFLDICDTTKPLPYADIIVAADVLYESKTGIALAKRIVSEGLQTHNSRIIIGCSRGRKGRKSFLQELKRLLPDHLNVNVGGVNDDNDDVRGRVGFKNVVVDMSTCNVSGKEGGDEKENSDVVSILELDPAVLCLPSSSPPLPK